MTDDIYDAKTWQDPVLSIVMPGFATLNSKFVKMERTDNGVQIIASVNAAEFEVYYFGIKPKKLIIISSGHEVLVDGTILYKSFEYTRDLCEYRLLIEVKDEKFTWN